MCAVDAERLILVAGSTPSSAATEAFGAAIGESMQTPERWLLSGELGAGKTAFARGMLRGLGVEAVVRSPTFTLAIPYAGRLPATHVDVYRLEGDDDLEVLGWDDVLADRVLIVEWGERAARWIGMPRFELALSYLGADRRGVELAALGAHAGARLDELRALAGRLLES